MRRELALLLITLLIIPSSVTYGKPVSSGTRHVKEVSAYSLTYKTTYENLEFYLGKNRGVIASYRVIGGDLKLPINFKGIRLPNTLILGAGNGSDWWRYYFKPIGGPTSEGVYLIIYYRNLDRKTATVNSLAIRNMVSMNYGIKLIPIIVLPKDSGFLYIFYSKDGIKSVLDSILNNVYNISNGLFTLLDKKSIYHSKFARVYVGFIEDQNDWNGNLNFGERVPIRQIIFPLENFVVKEKDTLSISLKRNLNFDQIIPMDGSNSSVIRFSIGSPIQFISGIKPNNTGYEFSGDLVYIIKDAEGKEKKLRDIYFSFKPFNESALLNIPNILVRFNVSNITSSNFKISIPNKTVHFINATLTAEISNIGNSTAYNSTLILPLEPKLVKLYQFLKSKKFIDDIEEAFRVNITDWRFISLERLGLYGLGIEVKLGEIEGNSSVAVSFEFLLPNSTNLELFLWKIGPILIYFSNNCTTWQKAMITVGNGLIFDKRGSSFALFSILNKNLISEQGTLTIKLEIVNSGIGKLMSADLQLVVTKAENLMQKEAITLSIKANLNIANMSRLEITDEINKRFYPGRWILGYQMIIRSEKYNYSLALFSTFNQIISIHNSPVSASLLLKDGVIMEHPEVNVLKNKTVLSKEGFCIVSIKAENVGDLPTKVLIIDPINSEQIDKSRGKDGFLGFMIKYNNETIKVPYTAYSKWLVKDDTINMTYVRIGLFGIAPGEKFSIIYGYYVKDNVDSDVSRGFPLLYFYTMGSYIFGRDINFVGVLKPLSSSQGKGGVYPQGLDFLKEFQDLNFVYSFSEIKLFESEVKISIKGFRVYIIIASILIAVTVVAMIMMTKKLKIP
ncbi:MAG: hypothetical protein ACP6IP_06845 [Candidatus Njordarchaeia archaeon]